MQLRVKKPPKKEQLHSIIPLSCLLKDVKHGIPDPVVVTATRQWMTVVLYGAMAFLTGEKHPWINSF